MDSIKKFAPALLVGIAVIVLGQLSYDYIKEQRAKKELQRATDEVA